MKRAFLGVVVFVAVPTFWPSFADAAPLLLHAFFSSVWLAALLAMAAGPLRRRSRRFPVGQWLVLLALLSGLFFSHWTLVASAAPSG